ncbi:outer membrane protein assembly factor BamA [Hansschlegelia plantiphila]|uniref:Outer membrane protein assembly factor BamA n=1 Tax=Hansschlegelia plantiphila TaxID=374655 RepID=A0A9W6J591_9HYPH|nr:outer membrane protein assembly factor BamA [Hansschlegelia plantiphila]GLK69518.1 outer membrane protein assembly factor BamA [Hansschlegelia plantiphila]
MAAQALVAGAGVSVLGVAEANAQSASNISVRGNQRVDAETVRSYFTGRGPLTQPVIDEGIRGLYASGLFSDVRVTRSGGGIVVSVSENQVINRVAFEGNSKVKDAVLTAEVQSKSRGPFNPAVVQSDAQRITEIYRRSGRYEATVTPKTINQPNGRVDLVFEINEGDKTKIQAITFEGNEAFGDGTLRDQMTTTESNWLSWIKTSDVYDPDRVNADLELLRKFYLNHGYADFRVISANADLDKTTNAFTLKIAVEEGQQYRFGAINVESNVPEIDGATLKSKIVSSAGSIYSAQDVDKSVEAMSLELAARGYAFAQVRPRGDRNLSERTIGLTYVVEEGARVYVERINIRGNTRTRDYVVRREFDIGEGDAYNQIFIDRAERRIKALGFFKTVKITTEPGSSPDRVIVNVDVEDQPTGEFSVAGGYSTSDGIIGEVALGERNFLGRGQYARIAAQFGQNASGFDFSFTEPYFLGYRVSAGFDAYVKRRDDTDYTSYKVDTYGGGIRFGFPVSEEFTIGTRYQLYQQDLKIPGRYRDIYNKNGNVNEDRASAAIFEAEGKTITSLAGLSLIYNTLDNPADPTLGFYAELKGDVAGLGGDAKYVRATFDGRYYHPLVLDNVIGMLRVQGGHVKAFGSDDLRVLDHFPGGPDLVRGFEPQGFGPRDVRSRYANGSINPFKGSPNDDPLGGTTYFGASAEAQFPIFGLPKEIGLKGAVFADAGTVFNYEGIRSISGVRNGDGAPGNLAGGTSKIEVNAMDSKKIRSSVGASLLWNSPLGPIRFDFAKVLTKEKYDETQFFRFSGGTRF